MQQYPLAAFEINRNENKLREYTTLHNPIVPSRHYRHFPYVHIGAYSSNISNSSAVYSRSNAEVCAYLKNGKPGRAIY